MTVDRIRLGAQGMNTLLWIEGDTDYVIYQRPQGGFFCQIHARIAPRMRDTALLTEADYMDGDDRERLERYAVAVCIGGWDNIKIAFKAV